MDVITYPCWPSWFFSYRWLHNWFARTAWISLHLLHDISGLIGRRKTIFVPRRIVLQLLSSLHTTIQIFLKIFIMLFFVLFWFTFPRMLLLMFEQTMYQHCFMKWLWSRQTTSHFLNQWWLNHRRIHPSPHPELILQIIFLGANAW